jgi:hypothetical protein
VEGGEGVMAKKSSVQKMTVSVFEINPLTEGVGQIDLPVHLHAVLDETKKAKERLMPLSNDENSKDSDLISNFVFSQKFLFGSFVRLNAGEVSSVMNVSLDKKTIQIDEMISEAQKGSAGSIHSSAFFCMYGGFLVMSGAHTNKKALEVYINWLLREHNREQQQSVFTPMKNTAGTIPIKEIQSIQFADTYLRGNTTIMDQSMKLSKTVLSHSYIEAQEKGIEEKQRCRPRYSTSSRR